MTKSKRRNSKTTGSSLVKKAGVIKPQSPFVDTSVPPEREAFLFYHEGVTRQMV